MPRYLACDLAGKALVLASVGWQLLILGPIAAEHSARSSEKQFQLQLVTYLISDIQNGSKYDYLDYASKKQRIDEYLSSGWNNVAGEIIKIEKYVAPAEERQKYISFVAFSIGSFLIMVGTWLEKRNKPAP
jgi:hypothetical protein